MSKRRRCRIWSERERILKDTGIQEKSRQDKTRLKSGKQDSHGFQVGDDLYIEEIQICHKRLTC